MTRVVRHAEFVGLAGVARENITPPVGIYARNWGSSLHDTAEGLHRPLFATALSIRARDSAEQLVVLCLDLSFWRSPAEEREIRDAILEDSGLLENELVVHQSHTHSAPSTAIQFASEQGGHLIASHRARVIAGSANAIRLATEKREPIVLTWNQGSCRLAFNRHFREPGSDRILIGLNPGAPADDELLVGRIQNRQGRVVAVLVNYACHPVSLGGGNKLISPDYVGAMREVVELHNEGAICVFMHGASGDLTPRRSYESDVEAAEQNGREIGFAAMAALAGMLPAEHELHFAGAAESGAALAIWKLRTTDRDESAVLRTMTVTARLRLKNLQSETELDAAISSCTDAAQRERLVRRRLLRATVGEGSHYDFPVFVSRLGTSCIVALPAEPHSEFQTALRALCPDDRIVVMNIANGYLGYLPPAADYALDLYQVHVALFGPGSMERVLEVTAAAIQRLKHPAWT